MTVFRGYLKGALRQRNVIILYLCIFLGLGTLMTMTMDEQNQDIYTSETLTMTVIDRDNSDISKGLTDYFDKTQELVPLEDKKEVLKEELYYGNTQYVLIIPEGFEKEFIKTEGNNTENLLQGTGRPGSMQNHYASELVDSYLSGLALYLQAGYDPENAVRQMENTEKNNTVTVMQEGSRAMSKVAGTLQYLPYILTALSCYVIGFVMLDYQKTDIKRRIAVSAVSRASRLMQMILALLVIGVAFFVVSILMTAAMNPGTILEESNKGYYLLNIGVMVLVGLSIAFMVVSMVSTGNAVNGLANVIALGMSFICGVFIPESMLGSSVRKLAKFLPVYWYEQNNTILGTHSVLSDTMIENLINGYEKQIIFIGVIMVLALVINRVKER